MSDDESYVMTVPDRCDRIVWRGRYYGLPYPNHAAALDEITRLTAEVKRLTEDRDEELLMLVGTVEKLEAERDALKAEVERLRAERDAHHSARLLVEKSFKRVSAERDAIERKTIERCAEVCEYHTAYYCAAAIRALKEQQGGGK